MGWTRWPYFALYFNSSAHYEKLIIVWAYVHHPHIHALSGVSFTGCMNELRPDCPPLSYTYIHTWAKRGELYELTIRQDHLHNIQACLPDVSYILPGVAYLHIHVSGGELWAVNEPARDRSGVCKTATQTDIKGLHWYRFDIYYVKVFGFQSDHR